MIQAKGFETALALGYVKCNVKFILEEKEEIGSRLSLSLLGRKQRTTESRLHPRVRYLNVISRNALHDEWLAWIGLLGKSKSLGLTEIYIPMAEPSATLSTNYAISYPK